MKTTNCPITGIPAALALVMAVLFFSCQKQDAATGTAGKQAFAEAVSMADAEADWVFDDIFNNALGVNTEVGMGGTGVFGRVLMNDGGPSYDEASGEARLTGADSSAACYQVSVSQLTPNNRFPLQITIDFGTGCSGKDGRIRKGRIIIMYTGNIVVNGNSAAVAFEGYYVDDIGVEGTVNINNNSTLTRKSYTVQVQNARLTGANGDFIEWNSEKTITQVQGSQTPLVNLDDVFHLSGQSSGTAQRNDRYFQWSTAITIPLVKRFNCPWIVEGTVSLKKGNSEVATLDYGTGNCDNKASFAINGAAHEITLH